jgi:phosphatidylglycerol---prolipoprotein diacylglyceryl transferase
VHPTPVYETLASLLIFWLLWRVRERWAPIRLFGAYLVLAGAERFLVELIRRNDEVLAGLTQPQLFSSR